VVGVEHRIVRITALSKNVIGQRTPVLDANIAARLRGFRLLNVIRIRKRSTKPNLAS
jgi:type IV secretory pathway ATPase VirB11/archaellum biosynthesis ATPase